MQKQALAALTALWMACACTAGHAAAPAELRTDPLDSPRWADMRKEMFPASSQVVFDDRVLDALLATLRRVIWQSQNYAAGGWLPLPAPIASVVDSASGANIRRCVTRGEMPLALSGASLWLAWVDSGGAHTATDTTTISAQSVPLWHTLRGAT